MRSLEDERAASSDRFRPWIRARARVADRAIVKAPYVSYTYIIRIRSAYVSYSTSSSANHVVEQLSGFYSLLYARCSCAVRAVGPFLRAGT